MISGTDEENKELNDIFADVHLNSSKCCFLVKDFVQAREQASMSINIKRTYKALYVRAKARASLKDYDFACDDIESALLIDPTDPMNYREELAKFQTYAQQNKKKSDAKLSKAMFGAIQEEDEEEKEISK